MTNSETLAALADRCEQATGPTVDLFREIYVALHGPKPERVHGGSNELTQYLHRFNPFYSLITHYAWLDAAMTLAGDELWSVGALPDGSQWRGQVGFRKAAYAATPALALCAACIRAIIALGH